MALQLLKNTPTLPIIMFNKGAIVTPLTRNDFLKQFLLTTPGQYHPETRARVAHLKQDSLRQASVLIGLVERPRGLNVILTKRAEHLKHHPGQVSFPGGKYEHYDTSLVNTALREAQEEIGLNPNDIHIVGQLPSLATVSQFEVTPVVGFVPPSYQIQTDPNEVAEVFEVPAHVLLDKNQLISQMFTIGHHKHRIFALTYQHHLIWGMTAQIVQALQNQIFLPHEYHQRQIDQHKHNI